MFRFHLYDSNFCMRFFLSVGNNHKVVYHIKYKYWGDELQSKLFQKTATLFYQNLFLRAITSVFR